MLKVVDLPMRAGVEWFVDAMRMYRAAPLQWSALVAGWLGVMLFFFIIPVIGQLAIAALQPVLTAGVLLAAAHAEKNGGVPSQQLFGGFKLPSLRALIIVGLIEATLASVVVVVLLQFLFAGVPLDPNLSPTDAKTQEAFAKAVTGKEWALALAVMLVVTIKGVFWYCVPLLTFNPTMRVSHAVRWSMYAALSNLGAMVVYALGIVVMMVLVMLPSTLLSILSVVTLTIGMPIVIMSNYFGYRKVFSPVE